MKTVIAFDFGASTCRAIKAEYDCGKLSYREIHRFDNIPVRKNGFLKWDYDYILSEIYKTLEKCQVCDSLAFDTWGVDYGIIDKSDEIIDFPVNYRDGRGEKAVDKVFSKITRQKLYSLTGNQIMPINTLFQMCEDKQQGSVFLFMPDLFGFSLCGFKGTEKSIASTSQMFDFKNQSWSKEAADLTGRSLAFFPEIVDAPAVIGKYKDIDVVKIAGHDTQCAVAAAPFDAGKESAFLSCGTWSLIGCELDSPILTRESMRDELSNEMGANGKINYLKNISGLWLIQEIRRNFKELGNNYSYADMEELAVAANPFNCFIDPDFKEFSSPGNIINKIIAFCENTNQNVPSTHGELIRCVYESLALKYRYAIKQIEKNTFKTFEALNILGGGTKDKLLCQMTSDCLGIEVIAGPTEATALGNIILQLIALGEIDDVNRGRSIIKNNEAVKRYLPENSFVWNEAYEKFCSII